MQIGHRFRSRYISSIYVTASYRFRHWNITASDRCAIRSVSILEQLHYCVWLAESNVPPPPLLRFIQLCT